MFSHKRDIWVRCFSYPLEGWSENLIRAFGQRIGNLVEIHHRNLNKEDCSLLHLLLEVGIHDCLLQMVMLSIKGKSFLVALKEVDVPVDWPDSALEKTGSSSKGVVTRPSEDSL